MTCKDCFHYEKCKLKFGIIMQEINGIEEYDNFKNWDNVEELCQFFKDKSKIVELPCKVGDTVYVVPSLCNFRLNIVNRHPENNRICEQKVSSIQMWNSSEWCLWTCDGLNLLLQKSYKENWFLTKEEAEARLKELKENG